MRTKTLQEYEEVLTVDNRDWLCLFERDADGNYLVTCPDLPPMIASGTTLIKVHANAATEIRLWLAARDNSHGPFRDLRV